jgi:hypothetical protein
MEYHTTSPISPSNAAIRIGLYYVDGHYVVKPTQVKIGNTTIDGTSTFLGGQVLIDSGSTVTYLNKPFYEAVLSQIHERISHATPDVIVPDTSDPTKPTLCWKFVNESTVDSDFEKFLPEITFNFSKPTTNVPGGTGGSITMGDYFFKDTAVKGGYCLRIAANDGLRRTDLGAPFLIGKRVTFSVNDEWLYIEENGNCTERSLTDRPPVVPIDGQLTAALKIPDTQDNSSEALALVILFMISVAIGVGLIVKKSVVYSPLQSAEVEQEDQIINQAIEMSQQISPRRRRSGSQLD